MFQQFQRPSGEVSMIRLLLSSTAIASLLVGGPALAADLGVKAPIFTKAPIMPVFSWTGFYFGGNAGGHWGRDNITTTATTSGGNIGGAANAAAINLASPTTLRPQGWLAGVQVGYNVQVNRVVLGLEGDADGLGGTNSRTLLFPGPVPPRGDALSNSTQGTFLATLRPRLGVVAFDHGLVYVTGGLAIGTVKTTDSATLAGGAVFETTSNTMTRVGWTAGGGLEYAFADNWSAKVEGLHVDLGGTYDTGIPCVGICAAATDIVVHHKYTDNIARFGINYHLGAPVTARY
jgi:outer membrane immunogenic protein